MLAFSPMRSASRARWMVAGVCCVALGCDDGNTTVSAGGGAEGGGGSAASLLAGGGGSGEGAAPSAALMADPLSLSVVLTANDTGIAESEAALERLSDARIIALANALITDHSESTAALQTIAAEHGIRVTFNPVSAQLEETSDDALEALDEASDADIDGLYLGQQTAAHATLLDLLDERLLPGAELPDVVEFLEAVRVTEMEHWQTTLLIREAIGEPLGDR